MTDLAKQIEYIVRRKKHKHEFSGEKPATLTYSKCKCGEGRFLMSSPKQPTQKEEHKHIFKQYQSCLICGAGGIYDEVPHPQEKEERCCWRFKKGRCYLHSEEKIDSPQSKERWKEGFDEQLQRTFGSLNVLHPGQYGQLKKYVSQLLSETRREVRRETIKEIKHAIVNFAIQGKFDRDEFRGLALYSRILLFFDKLDKD